MFDSDKNMYEYIFRLFNMFIVISYFFISVCTEVCCLLWLVYVDSHLICLWTIGLPRNENLHGIYLCASCTP